MTPLIAIIGSAEPGRGYDVPLRHLEAVTQAAEELGRELALAGFGLIVYSSAPAFIEADVVRGYVAAGKAVERSIQVWFPQGAEVTTFAEAAEHGDLFDFHADGSREWEVSFYRSVASASGLLLLGGGRSTFVAGIVGVTNRTPMVAVPRFGGYAEKVWELLDRDRGVGLATDAEIAAMARPVWQQGSAAELVQVLREQDERRQAERDAERRDELAQIRQRRRESLVAGLLFVAAVMAVPLGLQAVEPGTTASYVLLFATPLVAGAAGSAIRMVFEPGTRKLTETAVLGLIAGGISVILFFLSQLASSPDLLDGKAMAESQARGLLLFGVVIGFIAGFTFEAVYRRWTRVEVGQTGPIEKG
jgi:hypothetical protein